MNQVYVNSKKTHTLTPQHQRCCKICFQRNSSAISRVAHHLQHRAPTITVKTKIKLSRNRRRRRTLHDLSVHKHLTFVRDRIADPKEIRIPHFGKRSRVTHQVTRHIRVPSRTELNSNSNESEISPDFGCDDLQPGE